MNHETGTNDAAGYDAAGYDAANHSEARLISASAPGKLFLLGEYAVLDGAPALLTAVESRVTVTVTDSPHGFGITAPDIGIREPVELGPHDDLPDSLRGDVRSKLALVNEVRIAVDSRAAATQSGDHENPRGCDLTIDSAGFALDGHKLGLGSSAAVAVALTAALVAHQGISLTRSELFDLAFRAHSASQGGRGSGGDIAASVYGGHILFRQGSEPHSVKWPDNLDLFAVVTGTGSSTVDLVARVAEYGEDQPDNHRRDLHRLSTLACKAEEALSSAEEFLELADEYFCAIEELDNHAHAGIVTERHRELRALASQYGAVFKTSGAGGGDLGLVFAKLDSAGQLQSVFTEAGATVIPVPHSSDGVRMATA